MAGEDDGGRIEVGNGLLDGGRRRPGGGDEGDAGPHHHRRVPRPHRLQIGDDEGAVERHAGEAPAGFRDDKGDALSPDPERERVTGPGGAGRSPPGGDDRRDRVFLIRSRTGAGPCHQVGSRIRIDRASGEEGGVLGDRHGQQVGGFGRGRRLTADRQAIEAGPDRRRFDPVDAGEVESVDRWATRCGDPVVGTDLQPARILLALFDRHRQHGGEDGNGNCEENHHE